MAGSVLKSPFPPPPDLPPLNFHSFVFEKLAGNVPDDFVVQIDGITGEKRTYRQVVERVRDCATALGTTIEHGGLGLGSDGRWQDIVLIFSPNSLDYTVLVHAALAIAVPFCSLPANPTKGELVYLIQKVKAGPKPTRLHFFVHPSLVDLALAGANECDISAKSLYVLGGGECKDWPSLTLMIENVRAKGLERRPVSPVEKDTLAYLVFSSGTSGLFKAVMVSHGNLCHSFIQAITAAKTDDATDGPSSISETTLTILACLPFYHTYGLHVFILRALVSPQTMVILPKWNLEQALSAIRKYKINFLVAVPSILHQLAYSPKVAKEDLSSISQAVSGAAYLSPDVADKFREVAGLPQTDTAILEGYGMSEGTISSLVKLQKGRFGLPWDRFYTGVLIPGQEARIVKDDGSDANSNEPGELWLRGGNVTMGYWGDEKATKETFTSDGWLKTGDIFRVNEKGLFYFEDRAKDTLKISGAQVAPSEIERVLLSHPEGLAIDAAVAGVPSRSKRSEKEPRAWIVLSPRGKELGEKITIEKLDAWVKEQLSRYKWLTGGIEIATEIPKSPTGKVLRRVLVEGYVKSNQKKGWLAKL